MIQHESLWWLGQHLLISTALALVVLIVCRVFRPGPAARHVLWLLVLCRLIVPSIGIWPCPVPAGSPLETQPPPRLADLNPVAIDILEIETLDLDAIPSATGVRGQPVVPVATSVSDASSSPATESLPQIHWHSAAAGLWLIGSLAVLAVLITRIRRCSRLLATDRTGDGWLQRDVAEWCRRLGVRTPELLVSQRVRAPFLWCLGRVRLVWPQSLAEPLQREPARPIIVHELAHLKRRDHWTAWVELAALVIWWWNPMVWFVRRQLRSTSEMACDAWVVQLLPDERRAYAESLLELSTRAPQGGFTVAAVGADTGSRRAFQKRLELIMNEQISARFSRWTVAAAVLLGLISLPAFSTDSRSDDADRTESLVATSDSAIPAGENDDPLEDSPDSTPDSQSVAVQSSGEPSSSDAAAADHVSFTDVQELLERIESDYYGPVDRRRLVEAILSSLDANSQLISREDYEQMQITVAGEVAGVGVAIEIDSDKNRPVVTRPIRNSPAHAAGIRAGDIIVSIDGQPTAGLDLSELLERIRGRRGTVVTLGIRNAAETRDVEIVRDNLPVLGVEPWSVSEDGADNYRIDPDRGPGYVHVPAFTRQTAPELREILTDLSAAGLSGLVLDLRNCGGGLLSAATDVADMFLDEGIIVSSQGRTEDQTMTIQATGNGTFTELRLAVLVNGHTASAAEILAACLQDHNRAAIVGERTFGRGTVQSLFTLNDGSALKLTTAAWLRPSGTTLQRTEGSDVWGVQPDSGLVVPLNDEDRQRLNELYRQRLDGDAVNPDDDPQLQLALEWLNRG